MRPVDTGLSRSVYLSGWCKCPAFIVDSRVGDYVEPSIDAGVYKVGESTGYPDVDAWIDRHRAGIVAHQEQTIGTPEFFRQFRVTDKHLALTYALDPEESVFCAMRPVDTGLSRTVYISGWDQCPALIVDAREGDHVEPSAEAKVYYIGQSTGHTDVDTWVARHLDDIRAHQQQSIDTIEFLRRMQAIDKNNQDS